MLNWLLFIFVLLFKLYVRLIKFWMFEFKQYASSLSGSISVWFRIKVENSWMYFLNWFWFKLLWKDEYFKNKLTLLLIWKFVSLFNPITLLIKPIKQINRKIFILFELLFQERFFSCSLKIAEFIFYELLFILKLK